MQRKMNSEWGPQALAAWKVEDASTQAWIDDVELFIPPMLFHQRMDITNRNKTVEFYQAGGHTSCSVYGYYPTEKILFAGDLIFSGQIPYAGDATCDPEQWIAILKTWLNWDINRVIPGHGPVTDIREIEKHLEFFERLKAATLDTLKSGKSPQDIVIPTTYPFNEKARWIAERTQQRWYEYYRQG